MPCSALTEAGECSAPLMTSVLRSNVRFCRRHDSEYNLLVRRYRSLGHTRHDLYVARDLRILLQPFGEVIEEVVIPPEDEDVATKYFGFDANEAFEVDVPTIEIHDPDPYIRLITARKEQFLSKIKLFLKDSGISRIEKLRSAIIRRLSGHVESVYDLEQLWDRCMKLNPSTVRDALIDVRADKARRTLGSKVKMEDVATLQEWDTLYDLLGDRMQYSDIWFLSATVKEFIQIANLRGDIIETAEVAALRASGFYVLKGTSGVMTDDRNTFIFLKRLITDDIIVRAVLPDGTTITNDFHFRGKLHHELSTDIRLPDGDAVQMLYRRSGKPAPDQVEVEVEADYKTILAHLIPHFGRPDSMTLPS